MKDTSSQPECSVDGCDRPQRTRKLCATHYARLIRKGSVGGSEIKRNTYGMSAAEKFAHYADTSGGPDACHPWTGARHDYGYGLMSVNGKHVYAHRWICGQTRGKPLGPDEEALHSCDWPPCVNPRHLTAGTRADNAEDMATKGRGAGRYTGATHCVNGHELAGENLVLVQVKDRAKPRRRCRECMRRRAREGLARKRARLAS